MWQARRKACSNVARNGRASQMFTGKISLENAGLPWRWRWVSRKSTVRPCLSTARNSHFHSPLTRMHVSSTRQEPPVWPWYQRTSFSSCGAVLNPPPDGRVIHRDAAFRHHLFELAIADGVFAVPAHALEDEEGMERNTPASVGGLLHPHFAILCIQHIIEVQI